MNTNSTCLTQATCRHHQRSCEAVIESFTSENFAVQNHVTFYDGSLLRLVLKMWLFGDSPWLLLHVSSNKSNTFRSLDSLTVSHIIQAEKAAVAIQRNWRRRMAVRRRAMNRILAVVRGKQGHNRALRMRELQDYKV